MLTLDRYMTCSMKVCGATTLRWVLARRTLSAGRNVAERANELMSLPPLPELDLSIEGGKPAKRLMHKLGIDLDG